MNHDEEDVPPNNTLGGLLNKIEDGRAVNEFGAEFQQYLKDLRTSAKRRGARVVGEVTIKLRLPMGQDGYCLPTAEFKTKQIPKPKRPESTIYIDEDGDINGLPVPKQTTIFEVKGMNGKGNKAKDPAAPAVKEM